MLDVIGAKSRNLVVNIEIIDDKKNRLRTNIKKPKIKYSELKPIFILKKSDK